MKRSVIIVLIVIFAAGGLLFFHKPNHSTVRVASGILQTNSISRKPFNALSQNLADWTNAIPEIRLGTSFRGHSSWSAAPMNSDNYAKLYLTGVNGTNQFTASVTCIIDAYGNEVRSVTLQSQRMSVDETRRFGKSLLEMMGLSVADFDAWCSKARNDSMDLPNYQTYGVEIPNSHKIIAMGTMPGFKKDKPWVIAVFIEDR